MEILSMHDGQCDGQLHKIIDTFGCFAYVYMLSLSSPIYQVVMFWLSCFVLICMCDLAQPQVCLCT